MYQPTEPVAQAWQQVIQQIQQLDHNATIYTASESIKKDLVPVLLGFVNALGLQTADLSDHIDATVQQADENVVVGLPGDIADELQGYLAAALNVFESIQLDNVESPAGTSEARKGLLAAKAIIEEYTLLDEGEGEGDDADESPESEEQPLL
jgi:hypothetical protein